MNYKPPNRNIDKSITKLQPKKKNTLTVDKVFAVSG